MHDARPRKVGVPRLKHFGGGGEGGRALSREVAPRVGRVDDEEGAGHAQAVHVLGAAPVVVVDLEVADLWEGRCVCGVMVCAPLSLSSSTPHTHPLSNPLSHLPHKLFILGVALEQVFRRVANVAGRDLSLPRRVVGAGKFQQPPRQQGSRHTDAHGGFDVVARIVKPAHQVGAAGASVVHG